MCGKWYSFATVIRCPHWLLMQRTGYTERLDGREVCNMSGSNTQQRERESYFINVRGTAHVLQKWHVKSGEKKEEIMSIIIKYNNKTGTVIETKKQWEQLKGALMRKEYEERKGLFFRTAFISVLMSFVMGHYVNRWFLVKTVLSWINKHYAISMFFYYFGAGDEKTLAKTFWEHFMSSINLVWKRHIEQ